MDAPVVLLVNSNETERAFLQKVIKRFDYDTYAVDCAEQGLETFRQSSYAAVIIEINLPKMSGFELAQEIRRLEAEAKKRTPLIVIFEHADQFDLEKLRSALIEDFVIRPLYTESLRRILLRYVYDSKRPNLKILTPLPSEHLISDDFALLGDQS